MIADSVLYQLTAREQDIARLMVAGLKPREIAEELVLAYSTVRSYQRDLYSKLDVHGADEAVDKIEALGLLDDNFSPTTTNHNLPAIGSPLIGRQPELDILAERLVDPTTRLVTLLGPGGIGKTRLALEAAWVNRQVFANGAYLVALQPLRTSKDMLNAIVDALPLQSQDGGDQLAQLKAYFKEKHLLLILDNFEHLLDGVNFVTDLLAAAPGLWVLVTSRGALNVRDEWLLSLNGLAYPAHFDIETVQDAPAVQLFAERVQRVRSDFTIATETEAVVDICRLVEGLPLALEIAASWTKVAACNSIATEIQSGLDFLANRFQDMPARHHSMRAVFDHSWNLLTKHEQQILPRLAVFRGGFTREAALAVSQATWADLASLVEKSLIRLEGNERYGMHELLRQYAEDRLDEEQPTILAAHCAFFTTFMAERDADIKGRRQLPALDEIEADFDNVRMAWLHAVERQDVDALDAMLESLYWFCGFRARFSQSRDLLHHAWKNLDAEKFPTIWARLRTHHARDETNFWSQLPDDRSQHLQELRALIEPCQPILQQQGNMADIAFYELVRGKIEQDAVLAGISHGDTGNYQQAQQLMEHSNQVFAEIGDDFYIGLARYKIAWLYFLADMREKGLAAIHESLEIRRNSGDVIGSGETLSTLTNFDTIAQGNFELALQQIKEVQYIAREAGDLYLVSCNGASLCYVLWSLGRFKEAQHIAQELLPIAREINERLLEARFLQYFSLTHSMDETYNQASEYATKSQSLMGSTVEWEKEITHRPLAIIAAGQNGYAALKTHLFVLLATALLPNKRQPGHLITSLPLALFWLEHQGQAEYAASIMGLMASHPAESAVRWAGKWPAYRRLCQLLETELGPEQFAVARQQGAALDLRTVVESLIDMLN